MATYSDNQKAEALALLDANQGNIKRTANQLGIPVSTLRGWKNDRGINSDVTEMRPQKRKELSQSFKDLALQCVETALGKIDEASFRDLMGGAKISTEMSQLLDGHPTSIEKRIEDLTPDERRNRVSELLNTARTRGASSSVGDGEFYQ